MKPLIFSLIAGISLGCGVAHSQDHCAEQARKYAEDREHESDELSRFALDLRDFYTDSLISCLKRIHSEKFANEQLGPVTFAYTPRISSSHDGCPDGASWLCGGQAVIDFSDGWHFNIVQYLNELDPAGRYLMRDPETRSFVSPNPWLERAIREGLFDQTIEQPAID